MNKKHNKTNMSDNKKKSGNKKTYKITAIIVVAIFVVIIVLGILHEFRPERKLTQSQILAAKSIISKDLSAKGDNIARYTFSADAKHRNDIQIVLKSNSTIHEYLVNINSSQILIHTQTDIYNSSYYRERHD